MNYRQEICECLIHIEKKEAIPMHMCVVFVCACTCLHVPFCEFEFVHV